MKALQINNLSVSFNKQNILNGLTFELEEGSIALLSGASGCGKTTLLRCIAGFEQIIQGEISLFGRLVQSEKEFIPSNRRKIGMVFQDLALFPHLTVYENVDFVSEAIIRNRTERTNWTNELLKQLKISHKNKSYSHELSGGEKQRVAIARALAHKPKILLLDEPFSQLDDDLRNEILRDLLTTIRSENLTCLIVSHQNTHFEQMGFVEYRLVDGKIFE